MFFYHLQYPYVVVNNSHVMPNGLAIVIVILVTVVITHYGLLPIWLIGLLTGGGIAYLITRED